MFRLGATLFFLLLLITGFAQDNIQLINGDKLNCEVISDTGSVIIANVQLKNGNVKRKEFKTEEVFSIQKSGKPEQIIYKKNIAEGNVLSQEEMRMLIAENYDSLESLFGKDKVLLMNGQELLCKIVGDTGTVMIVDILHRKGKVKRHEVHKSEVFSLTKEGEEEIVIYSQNEMFGDIFTPEEMRLYMAGERDARANFNATPTLVVGFLLCGTIAYLGEDGYFTAMLPPIAYTVFQLIPVIRIREKTMSDPKYKYNDFYLYGYEPPARSRKIIRGMEGGFAGSATGVLLWFLLNKK